MNMTSEIGDIEKLPFEIHKYSSYATSYLPENILEDTPTNQASRWSSNTNNPPQFLLLKLKRPAIVQKVKFGKFEKSHVCNLKKFRVYGGLDENQMMLLLESGLKNDSIPEIFNLRCLTEEGEKFPVLYVKIMPLLSWGPSFNFSIWYVELHGQDDPMFMGLSLKNYTMIREIEIVKLCLKHFRQQGYEKAFLALQEETNIYLEDQLITDLHRCLVSKGDFNKTEEIIEKCVNEGMMDAYLKKQDYKHSWKLQEAKGTIQPGTRGGHQLVINPQKSLIYLFGGWDGFQDMSDLWVFHIETSTWSLIFEHSEQFGGPTPRSCHKMIFDPVSENIFILGRYLDNSIRTIDYTKSDFYLFDTRACSWLQICDDTSQVSGPQLVYDHQMCIDIEKRMIYVFGGKILTPKNVNSIASGEPDYSGLFSYHIATNTWTQILVDCHHPSACQSEVLSIKSRITHCMVFHNKTRKLYIYGGQRGKEDIEEFISYDVDTKAVNSLNKDNKCYENKNEPSPGYTLRATIDSDRDEIYIFSSLSKQKDRRDIQQVDASNSFWVYSLQRGTWSRIYIRRYTADPKQEKLSMSYNEPCPRYAHQLVYDEIAKMHYLFGGNPGKTTLPQLRLDDFWILVLEKPTREEILNHCRYLVRKLFYEEISRVNPIQALHYLQTHVSEVINHSDPVQLNNFHKMAAFLFKPEDSLPVGKLTLAKLSEKHKKGELHDKSDYEDDFSGKSNHYGPSLSDSMLYNQYTKSGGKLSKQDYIFEIRSHRAFLFNKLSQLMPTNIVQPKGNLSDFIMT